MKNLIINTITILVGLIVAILIINCQKAQRKCNIEPEVLKKGEHKEVYYQYLNFMEGKN